MTQVCAGDTEVTQVRAGDDTAVRPSSRPRVRRRDGPGRVTAAVSRRRQKPAELHHSRRAGRVMYPPV